MKTEILTKDNIDKSTVEELYNVFDFIRDLKPRKKNKVRVENFGI